jgi:3-phenylpropionate/trans-cinnamate dioxygenase ferredoxin component
MRDPRHFSPASFADRTPEFEAVASLGDLPEGAVVQRVLSSGETICLLRHRDQVSAVSDICTHEHFPISQGELLEDGTVQCAWHGARFDCRSGEVKQGPATAPLPVFEVRVEGDAVLVGPRAERAGAKYETPPAKVE